MGVWGPGNFDDDTAGEYVWGITERLIKETNDAMRNPRQLEPDEYWGVIVPCNVELLSLLASKRWGASVPKPSVVEQWKETYMTVWEGYIDKLILPEHPEHKALRREVLLRTFDELLAYARFHHQ